MRHQRRPLSLALLLPFALAACAEIASPAPTAPGGEPLVPTPSASRVTGFIDLFQEDDASGRTVERGTVAAFLWATDRGPLSQQCATSVVEGCELRRCEAGLDPLPEGAAADAGPITVEGLRDGVLTFRAYRTAHDPSILSERRFWEGGERVSIRAPGADGGAPAFDLGLTAPEPVRVTTRGAPDASRVVRGRDGYDVAWTGGTGTVRVQFEQTYDGGERQRLRCDYPASAGRATVPAAVLARVMVRAVAELSVMSVASERVQTDDLDLSFSLRHRVLYTLITIE